MTGLENQLGLDKVRLDKAKLINVLEANREQHVKEYREAREGWEKAVIAQMRANLEAAERGEEFQLHVLLDSKDGERPIDHSKDYDMVIKQLKASLDEQVILSQRDFQQYYLDEWSWKASHTSALSSYGVSGKR